MYKKFLSAILFGALTIASTSTFVSCKDYDDDISNLQTQIDQTKADAALNTTLSALQSEVTNLKTSLEAKDAELASLISSASEVGTANTDKITTILAEQASLSSRINSANEQIDAVKALLDQVNDGTVSQEVLEAKATEIYAAVEAVKTDLGASLTTLSEQLSEGLANEETARKAVEADVAQQQAALADLLARVSAIEETIFSSEAKQGIVAQVEALQKEVEDAGLSQMEGSVSELEEQVKALAAKVDAFNAGASTLNVLQPNELRALVFEPQTYYWGIEAAKISRLTPHWYTDLKELALYIDESDSREEVIGTKRPLSKENNIADYTVAGNLTDHERYALSSGTFTVMLNSQATYHVNPSTADLDDASIKVLSANKSYTRAAGTATVSLLGAASGSAKGWSVADGKLTVPLKVEGSVGTVSAAGSASDGVTVFATQVQLGDTTITSDYAAIVEETVSDLRLSHVKYNRSGTRDEDFISTTVFNNHCGECGLSGYNKRGMHLFGSVEEAKEIVTISPRLNDAANVGEGMDLVKFDEDIDLTALIETHYTNAAGQHDRFTTLPSNFTYKFELTDFKIAAGNQTNESAHAALYVGEDGHYYLHPQDPQEGGLNGKAYDAKKATEVVVNRVPLVRVSLIYTPDDRVVDYGYLPIRITKQKEEPKPQNYIWHKYDSDHASTLVRFNECYIEGGNTVNAIQTNWRQTEEDLMSHSELKEVLTREGFISIYTPKGTNINDLDQYYITNEAAYLANPTGVKPEFAPVVASDLTLKKVKVGTIAYESGGIGGLDTETMKWDIDGLEITALAEKGINTVTRAILLESNDVYNYPNIYVVFKSGTISVSDKTVSANMNVTAKRINEYWYKFGNAPFEQGTDELHVNVLTPEENKETPWKPSTFALTLSNVFLNNFNSGSWATNWVTFSGAPTTLGQPFTVANTKLDILFDDSSKGSYKGYTDAGDAKTFTVSNTTATDKSRKKLYATLGTTTQAIAEIRNWDGTNNDLKRVYVQLLETDYAKALLNYVDHEKIGESNVLKATLAVIPTTQEGTDVLVKEDDGSIKAAIKYTDNGVTRYCKLAVEDYKFDVRFLRPLSLAIVEGKEFIDATSGTDDIQRIPLDEIVEGYTDWRGSMTAPVWKSTAAGDALDYETYYSPAGTSTFTVAIQSVGPGQYLSTNSNVETNLNQSADKFVALRTVSSELDFKVSSDGKYLEYRNNAANVQEFIVKIPVEVSYYWGKVYEKVPITIKRTEGNVKKQ